MDIAAMSVVMANQQGQDLVDMLQSAEIPAPHQQSVTQLMYLFNLKTPEL